MMIVGILLSLILLLGSTVSNSKSESEDAFNIFPRLPVGAIHLTGNGTCKTDSELYLKELKNLTLWAIKMWDATAKSIDGVLVGNYHQLGDFHECIETQAPFLTQYCLVTLTAHIPANYSNYNLLSNGDHYNTIIERFALYANADTSHRNDVELAWCVPASCRVSDLQKSLTKYLSNSNTPLSNQGVTYSAKISETDCHTYENAKLDKLDIAFCILTVLLVAIVVITTFYDYYTERTGSHLDSNLQSAVTAFSARKNIREVFVNKEQSTDPLTVLHGFRAVSCVIVLVLHRFGVIIVGDIMKNADHFQDHLFGGFRLWKFILYRPDFIVDTFFTISGFLTAHSIFKSNEGTTTLKPWKTIFRRYMRITPLHAYVLFYHATLFNFTGSGPMWKRRVTSQKECCREKWYLNLLYVHNYIKDVPTEMCIVPTWSLANDFHFFLVGVLVGFVIIRIKKLGLLLPLVMAATSMGAMFAKIYLENKTAVVYFDLNFLYQPEFQEIYIKSHLRAAPYFIGFYAGYFYCNHSSGKKFLNVIQSVLVLLSCYALFLILLIGSNVFFDRTREYNAFESALFATFDRAIWSIATVGILFVAIYGSLPILNKMLSWRIWIPFSKLSFAAYIGHIHYHLRSVAVATSPLDYNLIDLIIQGVGDCVYIFTVALILHILVEAPFITISNILSTPGKSTDVRKERKETADSAKKEK